MASKKSGSDLLGDRMRSVTGGSKPQPRQIQFGQTPTSKKSVRNNKRQSERKEAFKQGLFLSASGERVQIVLKNISDTGARVDFFSGTAIFGQGELIVPSLGIKRSVRVVWKDQNSAGLRFE